MVVAGLMVAAIVGAQPRPGNPLPNMQEIAQSLGVECQYCHSAERGSGLPEPRKDIARAMIAMTRDLNARVQAATGKAAADATEVKCITCHRGVPIPKQLNEIITRTLAKDGAEAAVSQYRELRSHYFGHQTYDFGEDTLIGIADRFSNARPDDSIALMKLNLEFYPQSVQSMRAMAFAYTRKFDDRTAITILEDALKIEPENGIVQGQLEQLKSYQRRR
ncbi:MAG TPA: photosynthetic reaction center cytochrome c subunit family protein [Bryobacteraceae bacterium]|nr:photosynthetic reaction center cytochrome c subunit family protein [Bryobacteraceae bacterium]